MFDTQPFPTDPSHMSPSHVRHFMWNDDYIELLAVKLGLQSVKHLVDIGSGLGGLPGLFGLYMRPGSTIYGYDLSPEVVQEAQILAQARPYSVRFQFEVADARRLPLADGVADLVMCQHVLAHVSDPETILTEMVRVVRPGGRVVVFEPNRLAQSLILDSVTAEDTLEERLAAVRYRYYYEAGKRALGAGDDSIGDRLPALFRAAGLTQIEVRLNDKAAALVPPYDSIEKQVRLAELQGWAERFERNASQIQQFFMAGGGNAEEFAEFRAREMDKCQRLAEQITANQYLDAGGMVTYIVIGTR